MSEEIDPAESFLTVRFVESEGEPIAVASFDFTKISGAEPPPGADEQFYGQLSREDARKMLEAVNDDSGDFRVDETLY